MSAHRLAIARAAAQRRRPPMHPSTANQPPAPVPNNACAGAVPTGHAETVILRAPCDRLAALGYEAYFRSTGSQVIPMAWEEVPADIQQAWREAVRAIVQESERGAGVGPEQAGPTPCFSVGDRVFSRRHDMFGRLESIDHDAAVVRFEWPYDPNAEPVLLSIASLVHATEVAG